MEKKKSGINIPQPKVVNAYSHFNSDVDKHDWFPNSPPLLEVKNGTGLCAVK